MSHTPGPWEVRLEKSDSGETRASVYSTVQPHSKKYPLHRAAITGWGCVTQTVDNAHLIAAAPTGHELIQRAVADRIDDRWLKDARAYLAAIAKATGGAQ